MLEFSCAGRWSTARSISQQCMEFQVLQLKFADWFAAILLQIIIRVCPSFRHRGADSCRRFQKSARVCKVCVWETFYRLFADFFSWNADFLETFCRFFLWIIYSHAHFLHTFCTLSAANDLSSADFMHTYSVFADFLQNICTLFAENMLPFCRLHAHLF